MAGASPKSWSSSAPSSSGAVGGQSSIVKSAPGGHNEMLNWKCSPLSGIVLLLARKLSPPQTHPYPNNHCSTSWYPQPLSYSPTLSGLVPHPSIPPRPVPHPSIPPRPVPHPSIPPRPMPHPSIPPRPMPHPSPWLTLPHPSTPPLSIYIHALNTSRSPAITLKEHI
jgi:hypothetical protein